MTIEEILEKAGTYIEDKEQINIIEKAFQFAKKKHRGDLLLFISRGLAYQLRRAARQ